MAQHPNLLFLCTGNYYRSRFAETLFNTNAANANLQWRAFSCGLAVTAGNGNVGPMSKYAIEGLKLRGIDVSQNLPFPVQVQQTDLESANLIIALQETEHRPYLEAQFPAWVDRVEYWHVFDLGDVPAKIALPQIQQRVETLILRLAIPLEP